MFVGNDLLREGGPYRVRKVGGDQYSLSIPIPTDTAGLTARECPDDACSPGYFKVRIGTGLTAQEIAYCPYCRRAAEPSDFMTEAQAEYTQQIVAREALAGASRMFRDALGLGPSGKKKIGGGLLSIELSMKSTRLPPVGRLIEEELRRDVRCGACTLEHAVYGLAVWCPDCGGDIFLTHLKAELDVLRKVLAAVDTRRETLGQRVAARDIENTLEDLVSVCEATLKFVVRRHLWSTGRTQNDVATIFDRQIRNGFQNLERARQLFNEHTAAVLGRSLAEAALASLTSTFEKRHPIAHNLGVIDRKYLTRVQSGEVEGSEVRVTAHEVGDAIDVCEKMLADAYIQLFPINGGASMTGATR